VLELSADLDGVDARAVVAVVAAVADAVVDAVVSGVAVCGVVISVAFVDAVDGVALLAM
jgi:hypothetical protein